MDTAILAILCAGYIRLLMTHREQLKPWRRCALVILGSSCLILLFHSLCFLLIDTLVWHHLGAAYSSLASLSRGLGLAWSPRLLWEMYHRSVLYSTPLVFQAVFVTTATAYLLEHARRAREEELKASSLQATLLLARLQKLQTQLQPHFLFNTLTAIQSMVRPDPSLAEALLGRLGRFLRCTLDRRDRPFVSLREELELLDLYLDLEQVRFGERLSIHRNIDPKGLEAGVPQLLLQPLVENALKHGVGRMKGTVALGMEAQVRGAYLELAIWDSGPGMGPGATLGVGLENTRARLAHAFGDAATLTFGDRSAGGFQVSLVLPLEPISALVRRLPIDSEPRASTMESGGSRHEGAGGGR